MVLNMIVLVLAASAAASTIAVWLMARRSRRRILALQASLETCQKRLDHQTSRLSILSRALAGLQTAVQESGSSDAWQTLALDQARALLWADSAGFWRYLEGTGELELQVSLGLEPGSAENRISIDRDKGLLGQVGRKRMPVLAVEEEIASDPRSVLALPLFVAGELYGVFRFVRHGGDRLTARDMELMAMYVKQLELALENRDMVVNREKFYLELVQTLADILDARDAASQGQTKQARRLAREIGRELDMPEQFIYYLEFAALMHDIGKIGIDDRLLKKPGKLTPEEFEIVKQHPEMGYKILSPVTMLAPVAPMVLYHQEWFNGKGYPEGLSGEEIPLGARIVAVLDAWSAMTSQRPWRPALTKEQALDEIRKGSGTQFDPRVVEAFLAALERQGVLPDKSRSSRPVASA